MYFAKSLISNCLLITTMLVGLSTPTFDSSGSSYTPRVRCSRVCPCYYQSLFCRGYKYYNIPSDTSETIQNIDFTVSTNNQLWYMSNLGHTTVCNHKFHVVGLLLQPFGVSSSLTQFTARQISIK